jgi:hypothetical protein
VSVISINVDEEEKKILLKRAKKNLMSLREQAEDIIRRSCVSQKSKSGGKEEKLDDKLVSIFSRRERGKKK